MTAPTPGPVFKAPGFGLAQGAQNFMNAFFTRQQLGLEKQKVELAKQKLEGEQEMDAAALKKMKLDLEQQEQDIAGREFASSVFMDTLTGPGGLNEDNIRTARIRIAQEAPDKKLVDNALASFDKQLTEATAREQARATLEGTKAGTGLTKEQTRGVASEADVLEATEEARTQAGQLAGQITEAQLSQINANTKAAIADIGLTEAQTEELINGRDPAKVSQAIDIWMGGQSTWKEARESLGLSAGGIPDEQVFSPTLGGAGGELQQKALNFALQMIPTDGIINSLTRESVDENGNKIPGVRVTLTGELQKAATNGVLRTALNTINDPRQQQVLQAGMTFVMAYRFFMSGQQSSDKEYLNMMKIVMESAGDSDEVIKQKRAMRQTYITAVRSVAGEGANPVTVLNGAIQELELQGLDKRFIDAMKRERNMAIRRQAQVANGTADNFVVDNAPGSATMDFVQAALDSLGITLDTTASVGPSGRF